MALKIAEKGFSQAKQKSIELYGYDFFGLIQKLVIFYVVALIIAKYYEAVKYGSGFIGFIAGLFGYEIPKVFPESLMRFFDTGYNGIKYWDLIHIIAILLITAEAMRHEHANQPGGMNPTSWGIFGLMGGFIGLISVPSLLQRMKEQTVLGPTTGPDFYHPSQPSVKGSAFGPVNP